MQVFVRDNNVDQALRALKQKMQREGVFREMQQEYASGNFTRYGELLQQLEKLLLPQ